MGRRGELRFVFQMVIFALILISPEFDSFSFPLWLRGIGLLVLLAGGAVGTLGVIALGRNLSPFPKPKEGGFLVSNGVYGLVRHPIYSGLVLGTLGWSLVTDAPLGLFLAAALLIFFEFKSRREEKWLVETYPDYSAYQARVRKLIPFIY